MEILDSHQVPQGELKYAGFWIRVAAMIIDVVVIYIAIFLCGLVATTLFFANGNTGFGSVDDSSVIMGVVALYGVLLIVIVSYFALMESSDKQGTLGKIAVGIKVGKYNGDKISFANAIGRYFSKILSSLIFYIGYIMVAFDPKKQGLHDKIANTYVYYK